MRIPTVSHRSTTSAEDSRPVSPGDTTTTERERAERVVAQPRPRSSGLATIGLIAGVLAVAAVATGVLAAPGVALGVVAALLGVGGVAATGRRHVAGRSEALFAVLLGLAAVVFGILALSDSLSWLSSNTNEVSRLRDWLNDQLPWLNDL